MLKVLSPSLGMLRRRGFLRVLAGIVTTTLALMLPASAASVDQIFFVETNLGRINRMNPDGTGVVPILQNLNAPHRVVADPIARKIYFSTIGDGSLRRANYDGTGVETILSNAGVSALELDLTQGKIYLIAQGGVLLKTNLDGTEPQTLVQNTLGGTALTVDQVNGKIYYTSPNGTIVRVDLDGTNPELVVLGALSNGVAINPGTNELFYTASGGNVGVFRVDLQSAALPVAHSSQPPLLNFGPLVPLVLDPVANQIYFASSSTLFRADTDGSNPVTLAFNRGGIFGIAVAARKNRVVATLALAAPGIADATFRSFGNPVVNSQGNVAFDTVLASSTGAVTKENDKALWSDLGGALTLIARENGPSGINGVDIKSWSALHMSNNLLVFRARLAGSGVTTADDDAICAWDGTSLRLVAREGIEASGFTWGTFSHPTINDRGQVLFTASFTSNGARGSGLFVTEPGAGDAVALIARGGDLELDGTVRTVKSFTKRLTNVAEGALANSGYTAATLKLTDGRTVLAVIAE